MNQIFDSHAHYDDHAFDEDRDALLSALPEKGVGWVLNVGADLAGSADSIRLAQTYPFVYAGVGVHPENAFGLPEDYLSQVEQLAQSPKVKAIGEIGLDYHYEDACPRDIQQRIFEEQLLLANRLGLPVVVHDREAHQDTLRLLKRHRPAGVVHCFSGSVEMMRECVALGLYIGLGGVVTFKNARVPVEVAAAVPLDRLLLETDAPYMAPVPFRGKRNDSSLIAYVGQRIAQLKEISVEELFAITARNAANLLQIQL